MFAASAAVDATFAIFGVAASYAPPGGGPSVDCTVIRDSRDRDAGGAFDGRPFVRGEVIEVRTSDLAPAKGGTFTIGSAVLMIADEPRSEDADRLVWRCTVQ